jgi:uncharacterized protein (DUF983 family)
MIMKSTLKRDEPVQDSSLIRQGLIRAGLFFRCPNCGQGKIFKSFFKIHDTCSHCHVRFDRDTGNLTGSGAINYFLGCIITFFISFWMIRRSGFFDGVTFVILGLMVLLTFILFRPAKALWVGFIWVFGFVYTDDDI